MTFLKPLVIVLLVGVTACAIALGRRVTQPHRSVDRGQLSVSVDATVNEPMALAPLELADDPDFSHAAYWNDESRSSTNAIELMASEPDSAADDAEIPIESDDSATHALQRAPQSFSVQHNARDISQRSDSDTAEQIVRDAMPDATAAERRIWLDQLSGMSPDEIRFLMSQRQRLGSTSSLDAVADRSNTVITPQVDKSNSTQEQTAAALLRQNLANSNTIGYRQRVPLFSARRNTDGPKYSLRIDQTPGRFLGTERPLDLAIDGTGFFCLCDASGKQWYCRSAPFVFRDGQIVLDEYGADDPLVLIKGIPADARRITIAGDGAVSVELANAKAQSVGRIRLVTFLDASQLHPVGQSLFGESIQSGTARFAEADSGQVGRVIQGSLEQSNVDPQLQREELKMLELQNQDNDSCQSLPPQSFAPVQTYPPN